MNKWNGKRFSIYDKDEKQVLGLLNNLGEQTNYNTDEIETTKENLNKKVSYDDMKNKYKIDENANFTGSWFGIKRPTASNEGLQATVDEIKEETLPSINQHINIVEESQLKITNPLSENVKQPILVIVDDDIRQGTYTHVFRLCKEKGIKISLSCIPDFIEKGQVTWGPYQGKPVATKEQIQEMYNYGFDLLCHGYTSKSLKDYFNNESEIISELVNCKNWLIKNNFVRNESYNYLVYPQGLSGTSNEILGAKNLCRRFFKYGLNAFNNEIINGVFDSFNIPRVWIDDANYENMKSKIDSVVASKGLLVFGMHGYSAEGQDYNTWKLPYENMINYAIANGVKIMTFGDAIKLKGNVFSIGEFTNDEKIYINNDGTNTFQNVYVTTTYQTTRKMDDDLFTYKPLSDTIVSIQSTDDTFLNTGGTMQVRRSGKYMSYALYFPYNSNKIYKRRYDEQNENNVWLEWELINNTELINYIQLTTTKNITTTGTFATVPFDKTTTVADLGNCFDTVTNTFTVPSNGNYAIDCQVGSSGNVSSDTDITLAIFKNGVEQNWLDRKFIPSGKPFLMKGVSVLKLNKNDTIQIKIRSTVAINLDSNGVATGLSIRKK